MRLVTGDDGRSRLDTGSPWEPRMGYSRAVQAGPWLSVAGCVGIRDDGTYPEGLTAQADRCLDRIAAALAEFGADLGHVVKIRIYTTCIDRWEEIADAVGPRFRERRPANVLVEVSALVDPAALVEIEADAWIDP